MSQTCIYTVARALASYYHKPVVLYHDGDRKDVVNPVTRGNTNPVVTMISGTRKRVKKQ
jgi:hypothetical protein